MAAFIVPTVSRVAPLSKPEMKLLVLAQTPPPVHGQSLAVAALLGYLRTREDWQVFHVNLRVSRDAADIGRVRIGKLLTALAACLRVWGTLFRHGRMPIYYVPAPGKRSALYRDWLVLGLCRPFAGALILHWHAVGLGEWLDTRARGWERWISRGVLGGAKLAIAQAEAGRADCERLQPQRCVVIRNGVEDPLASFEPKAAFRRPCEVLFVGLASREKGLFDALAGVARANAAEPEAFRLTAIGPWASREEEAEFRASAAVLGPGVARHLGFVGDAERNAHLRAADVFCFPSYYPHEGQPAVLLEALAHDLPIVTTRWRGIPENLPTQFVQLVEPRAPEQIAAALRRARDAGPAGGALRAHFLAHFTRARHLQAVEAALRAALAAVSRA